jgi:hypothetical protein
MRHSQSKNSKAIQEWVALWGERGPQKADHHSKEEWFLILTCPMGHMPIVHQGYFPNISASFLCRQISGQLNLCQDNQMCVESSIVFVLEIQEPRWARRLTKNTWCSRHWCFSSIFLIFILLDISRTTLSCLPDTGHNQMICFDQGHVNGIDMYLQGGSL